MKHSLTLTHRGPQHVHVFQPSCICGWVGVPRRRKKEAEAQYHVHAEGKVKAVYGMRPRKPTKAADLPPELQ